MIRKQLMREDLPYGWLVTSNTIRSSLGFVTTLSNTLTMDRMGTLARDLKTVKRMRIFSKVSRSARTKRISCLHGSPS